MKRLTSDMKLVNLLFPFDTPMEEIDAAVRREQADLFAAGCVIRSCDAKQAVDGTLIAIAAEVITSIQEKADDE